MTPGEMFSGKYGSAEQPAPKKLSEEELAHKEQQDAEAREVLKVRRQGNDMSEMFPDVEPINKK